LIGIVADNSAITMAGGLAASTSRPVALAGRLLAKVSLENGPIAIGDSLTSASSTPGVAIKATNAGRVIGIALEPFDGPPSPEASEGEDLPYGKILIFVNPHWQGGDLTVGESNDGNLVNLDSEELGQKLANLGLRVTDGQTLIVKKVQAKFIETRELKIHNPEPQKTGMTIADRATSDLYCVYVENNEMKTERGECLSINNQHN